MKKIPFCVLAFSALSFADSFDMGNVGGYLFLAIIIALIFAFLTRKK